MGRACSSYCPPPESRCSCKSLLSDRPIGSLDAPTECGDASDPSYRSPLSSCAIGSAFIPIMNLTPLLGRYLVIHRSSSLFPPSVTCVPFPRQLVDVRGARQQIRALRT